MFKKKIMIILFVLIATPAIFAQTKRVGFTKDRNCNQIVIMNNSSQTVRLAQADGVNVTGWTKSGYQSSFQANNFVLEIGSNCDAFWSVQGKNYVVTVTEAKNSSNASNSRARNVMCTTCAGSGKCSYCNGRGYIYTPRQKTSKSLCPHCKGKGICTACNGKGQF